MCPLVGLSTSAGVLAMNTTPASWQVAHAVAVTAPWFMLQVLKSLVLVWQVLQVTDPVGMCPLAGLTTTAGVPGKDLLVSWQVAHGVAATAVCCVAPICHGVKLLVLVWQVSHAAVAVMCPFTWPNPGPAAPWHVRQLPAAGWPVIA